MRGEDFQQQGMGDAAIQNNGGFNTTFYGLHAGLDLRNHAAGDGAVLDHGPGLFKVQVSNQFLVLVQNTGNVCQHQQATGTKRGGNGTGCCVSVDIVGFAAGTNANRGNDRG